MKKKSIIFVLVLSAFTAFGQDKKDLGISISGGILNSPYFYKSYRGNFFSVGFDYHISERHIIAANFLAGEHRYFENELSNVPSYDVDRNGRNATAIYKTFSVVYKYKLINNNKFSLIPGIGAGVLTNTYVYPHKHGSSTVFNTSTWSDLAFPVTLDINYKVFKQWQLGLTSGFLIEPDFPILALHIGPKLTYIIK